jgi:hypothetical protein
MRMVLFQWDNPQGIVQWENGEPSGEETFSWLLLGEELPDDAVGEETPAWLCQGDGEVKGPAFEEKDLCGVVMVPCDVATGPCDE